MVVNNRFLSDISKVSGGRPAATPQVSGNKPGSGFESVFRQAVDKEEGLKFSKHAEMRLESRNIKLTQSQKDRISEAVKKAGEKGVKDTLVMLDNVAMVVNVRNRTVITAVNNSELKDNVFTNIDGAVFV